MEDNYIKNYIENYRNIISSLTNGELVEQFLQNRNYTKRYVEILKEEILVRKIPLEERVPVILQNKLIISGIWFILIIISLF